MGTACQRRWRSLPGSMTLDPCQMPKRECRGRDRGEEMMKIKKKWAKKRRVLFKRGTGAAQNKKKPKRKLR